MIRQAFRIALAKSPGFVRQMLSEQDGLASTKRFVMVAAVLVGLALLAFDVVVHWGFRTESITVFTIMMGATFGAYGVTQFAQ